MAIVNRDLAPNQQVSVRGANIGAFATGVTNVLFIAENPQQVITAAVKAFGLSGSPVYSLNILRAVGGGLTSIGLGATITAVEGTTLWQGISITLGATIPMQTGDVLMVNSGAANTAVTGLMVSVAVQHLQDVRTFWGVSLP